MKIGSRQIRLLQQKTWQSTDLVRQALLAADGCDERAAEWIQTVVGGYRPDEATAHLRAKWGLTTALTPTIGTPGVSQTRTTNQPAGAQPASVSASVPATDCVYMPPPAPANSHILPAMLKPVAVPSAC